MSTVSLVLISPSTVMRLKLWATACSNDNCSAAGAIAASVVMKHNIVACNAAGRLPLTLMPGWIIPAPLHTPPIRVRFPSSENSTAICFGCVSLVMIASATCAPCSGELPKIAIASAIPHRTFCMGSVTPILPVELTNTEP